MQQNKPFYLRHLTIATLTTTLCLPLCAQGDAPNLPAVPPAPETSTPQTATPQTAVPQTEENDKIQLRFVAPTAPYIVKLAVDQKVTATGKLKMTLQMKTQLDFRFEPLAVEPSAPGHIPIRITVAQARFSRTSTEGKKTEKIDYDSKKPPKKVPEAAETLSLLHGTSFDAEFDSTGRIRKVRNIDQVVEQVLDKMKVDADQRKYLRDTMRGMLDDAAFKNFGNVLASFPPQPIGIGEQWRKTDPVSSNDPLIYDTLCTLTGHENGIATISVRSAVRPDPKRKDPGPVYAPQGSQTGSFEVDETTGQTRRAELKQFLTAHIDELGQFSRKTAKTSKLFINSTFTVETAVAE